MWKLLNYLRGEYMDFLQEWDPDDYQDYPPLEEEIIRITRQSDFDENNQLS
jgi:hypothetical protein